MEAKDRADAMNTPAKTAYNKAYYAANRDKLRADNRERRMANRESVIQKDRARYKVRREAVLAQKKANYPKVRSAKLKYNREYWSKNRARLLETNKARRARDAEKIKLRNRRYMQANREKVRLWNRRWAAKNQARMAQYDVQRRGREKASPEQQRLIEIFYQNVRLKRWIKCYYCGRKTSGKAAHIDHVIALSRSGNHAVENLAATCPDCNFSKGPKLPHEWPKHPQMFLAL